MSDKRKPSTKRKVHTSPKKQHEQSKQMRITHMFRQQQQTEKPTENTTKHEEVKSSYFTKTTAGAKESTERGEQSSPKKPTLEIHSSRLSLNMLKRKSNESLGTSAKSPSTISSSKLSLKRKSNESPGVVLPLRKPEQIAKSNSDEECGEEIFNSSSFSIHSGKDHNASVPTNSGGITKSSSSSKSSKNVSRSSDPCTTIVSDNNSNCDISSVVTSASLSMLSKPVIKSDNSTDSILSIDSLSCKSDLSSNKTEMGVPSTNTSKTEKVWDGKKGSTTKTKLKKERSQVDKEDQDSYAEEPEPDEPVTFRIPYYLENFQLIVDTVLKDDYYNTLFDDEDHKAIDKFRNLSEDEQKLYVRLFQRNHRWLRKNRIQYPKIAEDLSPILQLLVTSGLLLDESHLSDLETILSVLPAADVKTVAKSLKLNPSNTQKELVAAIIKHSKQGGISLFLSRGGGSAEGMITKRAKALLRDCYYVERNQRTVFVRVMMLFGLHRTYGEDEEEPAGQQQIFQMLMSTIGRIKYPEYTVCREARIFKDRAGFIRFCDALHVESNILQSTESKNYEEALKIFLAAKPNADEILTNADYTKYDQNLPPHLRGYTAGAVYTRTRSLAVELHQFLKKYQDAVQGLETLLDQQVYHREYRGRWYERLALNLDHHLKEPNNALDVIKKALSDPSVITGHRLALLFRAQRLCQSKGKNKKLKDRWKEFEKDSMNNRKEAPKITIQGRQIAVGQQGPLYISNHGDTEDVTLMTRVEDVALAHYKAQGYSHGIHGEGGTFTCLLALYFWDIIFMDGIPDTFYNPYQVCPLDWRTEAFYQSRSEAIEQRLTQIEKADPKNLKEMLETSWNQHQDTLCMGINWERFSDLTQAQGLVQCIGGAALSGILGRLVRVRRTAGGMPDLAVWNPDTSAFKLAEVKGPGDHLSTKQILWLDYFLSLGVDAEVCHVQAIGAKKLTSK